MFHKLNVSWWLIFIVVLNVVRAYQKGNNVGCFRSIGVRTVSLKMTTGSDFNCFDFCATKFYRFSVLQKNVCSCENTFGGNEEEPAKCNLKCQNRGEEIDCGGDQVENYYETGSIVPGKVRNLTIIERTVDTLSVRFDPPERNGTELTGYDIHVFVISTYSTRPWDMRNRTLKAPKTTRKLDISDLLPSTKYRILVVSKGNDLEGGIFQIEGTTKLGIPDPKPDPPIILQKNEKTLEIEISKAVNNHGPVSNYLVIVQYVDDELVIQDLDEKLLFPYEKSLEYGLDYYVTAELLDFQETLKKFLIGDGKRYGNYLNTPLSNRHLHIILGIVSEKDGEKKVALSKSSHEYDHEILKAFQPSIEDTADNFLIIILSTACIIGGLVLLSSIMFYGYIRLIRINPRDRRSERHEMSLQGPILEVDNNGFISDVAGMNFKEKLTEALLNLDEDQKIVRKNLSLDIDNIIGMGSFGDVIKGQVNGNSPAQVHVVSADDMDPPVQIAFIRELNNLLHYGFHKSMLNFVGICQTHDWFFVVFEDTPATLKQYLISFREDQNLSTRRLANLSEDHALRLMFEISETLEYLKYNKIVHKNINSHNVRVKRQNSTWSIKLSFFGPTLYQIDDDLNKNMIDEDRWFAPEVMRFQKYSHASDVYSLALVMWEICCVGATIYGSIATSDLLTRIKKGIRPEKFAFISEDLYQLLLNCWELDPNERYEVSDIVGQMKHFQLSPQYYLNFSLDGPLPYYMPLLETKS